MYKQKISQTRGQKLLNISLARSNRAYLCQENVKRHTEKHFKENVNVETWINETAAGIVHAHLWI